MLHVCFGVRIGHVDFMWFVSFSLHWVCVATSYMWFLVEYGLKYSPLLLGLTCVLHFRVAVVLGALPIRATMAGHVQTVATVSRVIVLLSGQGKSAQQVCKLIYPKIIAFAMNQGLC